MPYAFSPADEMFNSSNLNDLYARFDRKCFLTLNGKSPLFGTRLSDGGYGLPIPYGVVYQYRRDAATCRRLASAQYLENYSQQAANFALSQLEVVNQDLTNGQVYVDRHIPLASTLSVDIKSIHFSFELLKRSVGGIDYDVHLGWEPTSPSLKSVVKNSLGFDIPLLPPGRIHKHRLAVADIWIEGFSDFIISNKWQRYDCWRIHNCNSTALEVELQLPDGGSTTVSIEPCSCRAFRRAPNGLWITTWPGGEPCRYFFPYLSGDVPYFAGGPPTAGATSHFIDIEKSAAANNIADPFILFRWYQAMWGQIDPDAAHDILTAYRGAYADPMVESNFIGDVVFTWGRAKVVRSFASSGITIDERIVNFAGVETLLEDLESIGTYASQSAGSLSIYSRNPNVRIRIYPIDANIFVGGINKPYWEITATPASFSTSYPTSMYRQDTSQMGFEGFAPTNLPDIFETIKDLRRRIAVEEGYFLNYNDEPDVAYDRVSRIYLTPIGLICFAVSDGPISLFDGTYAYSTIDAYEKRANVNEVFIRSRNIGDAGPFSGFANKKFVGSVRTYILQGGSTYASFERIFPRLFTSTGTESRGVNAAFVPAGGPWGFASSVYDPELSRVLGVSAGGADFWINKWGGANGVDATVRVLGQPDQTLQTPIQTTTATPSLVRDDVFRDANGCKMAGLAGETTNGGLVNIAQINYKILDQYFDLPYEPSLTPQAEGTGPIFHKLPKSAWLWNLLEWFVESWTRSIPLCMGNESAPLIGGIPLRTLMDTLNTGSATDSGQQSYAITAAQYADFLSNGINAYRVALPPPMPPGTYDHWVPAQALADYCARYGFTSFNFDTFDALIGATRRIPLRSYSEGETTQVASYKDGPQLFRSIRYVKLD